MDERERVQSSAGKATGSHRYQGHEGCAKPDMADRVQRQVAPRDSDMPALPETTLEGGLFRV